MYELHSYVFVFHKENEAETSNKHSEGTGEVVQQVKALVTKPGDLGLSPRTHRVDTGDFWRISSGDGEQLAQAQRGPQ